MLLASILLSSALLLALTYASWLFILYLQKRRRVNANFQGPLDRLFIGNAHMIDKDGFKFYKQMLLYSEQYADQPAFRVWLGTMPMICIHRPEWTEKVLGSTKLIDKTFVYNFLLPWIGTGLLTSNGAKWHSRRKMLTPAFHFRILADFLPLITENAQELVNLIHKHCRTTEAASIIAPALDVHQLFSLLALDIMCESAMGVKLNALYNAESAYVQSICALSENAMSRAKTPLLYNNWIYQLTQVGRENQQHLQLVHQFTESVIQKRKLEFQRESDGDREEATKQDSVTKKRLAFLDLLLTYQKSQPELLTDLDIREEVDTFMFEGHDTTAAAMTWTLLLLAHHPDIQRQVQTEVDAVLQSEDGPAEEENPITPEHLSRLVFLDKVLKEALRLYPSVPMISRECPHDMEIDGYWLPKGAQLLILITGLQRNPHVFPRPNEFDPSRFDSSVNAGRSPFASVPFSAGPRNCIGAKFAQMELKVVLAKLMREFHVHSNVTVEECAPASELILRPSNPVLIHFQPRQQ